MAQKPTVLILGGVNVVSAALANYLVPSDGEALVSALRIVDKFSVNPPTTYIGSRFKRTITSPLVEYRQANLLTPATVSAVFEPSDGKPPFSFVFDFTGETRDDRSDELQFEQTTGQAHSLGTEAARRGVTAYVRLHQPFYDTPLEKGVVTEKDSPKPQGIRGYWWHESIRVLAGIPKLNLVILRTGAIYGPQLIYGIVNLRIILGSVYRFKKEEMKYLWSGGIRINTVHTDDVAGALWAVAKWMEPLGREQADKLAGETIPYYSDKDKAKAKLSKTVLDTSVQPIAPLFTIVDETDTTAQVMGEEIAKVFDIKFGFYGLLASTAFRFDFDSMIEDINESHMEPWTTMITTADPPIPNTPLTVWIDASKLSKHSVAYNGDKIKKVVGYQLSKPKFSAVTVREVVDSFKEEGTWPNVPGNI